MKREEDESNEGYLHRERTYSQAQRVINFPEEVDPDKVEATMADGILELKIMKKEPAPEERMRKIQL
jgi:HSP20 family protein